MLCLLTPRTAFTSRNVLLHARGPRTSAFRAYTAAMSTISYISVGDLSTKLRAEEPVVVVDVRGEDREGGHIKGSAHVPAADFKRDISSYISQWQDKEAVVFHCMMSQVRGPSCARAFAAAGEAALKSSTVMRVPQIMILEGGFQAFAHSYADDTKDLFQGFDERLYGVGWERD